MALTPLIKALSGVGSRRWLADAIRQGLVEVNDMVVEDFRHPVDARSDRVSIGGRAVDLGPGRKVYLMLNKPKGVLSTAKDERGRRTVMDLLPEKYRRVQLHQVGRLDKDSTGLLLLTNDGELTYRLTHPKFEQEKEYLVAIKGRLKPGDKTRLEQGLELEDGFTGAAVVRGVKISPFNYSITIHEGRKRQIRRMFEELGHRVVALKRIRIAGLLVGDLEEGDLRELRAHEVRVLLGSGPHK